jgi:hypothetical protein
MSTDYLFVDEVLDDLAEDIKIGVVRKSFNGGRLECTTGDLALMIKYSKSSASSSMKRLIEFVDSSDL